MVEYDVYRQAVAYYDCYVTLFFSQT